MAGVDKAVRQRKLTREQRLTLAVILLGILAAAITLLVDYLDNVGQAYLLERLRGAAYDLALSLRPSEAPGSVREERIVIIGFDDQTLQKLGGASRIPRSMHAELIRRLHEWGARVIAFDMYFDLPDPAGEVEDAELAQAMREHGNVVVAGVFLRQEQTGITEANLIARPTLPIPALRPYCAVGLANVPEDVGDRTVRRFEWYLMGLDDQADAVPYPALGVVAVGRYLGVRDVAREIARIHQGRFAGHEVALVPGSRSSYIDYLGEAGIGFRILRYEDVLGIRAPGETPAEIDPAVFKNAIALVGDIGGLNQQDVHRTPIYNSQTGNKMAGVQIQANIAHTILRQHYLRVLPRWLGWLLVVCASLATAIIARRLAPLPGAAVALATLVVGFGFLSLGCMWARLWVEPVTPFTGGILSFILSTGYMNFTERRRQQEVRRHFSRFVGPEVMEEILKEEHVALTGEQLPITLLFSDLQGFTALAETRSAPEVVSMLNDYFDEVIPIILKHGGTLDKLMGDGIMAYFGAPRPQPDHAARAVRCALEMQEALARFRRDPVNQHLPPLHMRIGLHSGEAVVGEIGWRDRTEYSVIGDVVNVASRLEGLNKEFGTTVLISETTYQQAKDVASAEFMGRVRVKGRREPVAVYAIGPRMAEVGPPAPQEVAERV